MSFLDIKFKKMANMKRGGEYDNGMGGPKRSRAYTDKFEMRILVPSKVSFNNSFGTFVYITIDLRWLALLLAKEVKISRRSDLTSRPKSGSLTAQGLRG